MTLMPNDCMVDQETARILALPSGMGIAVAKLTKSVQPQNRSAIVQVSANETIADQSNRRGVGQSSVRV